jgi:hypothetical protein
MNSDSVSNTGSVVLKSIVAVLLLVAFAYADSQPVSLPSIFLAPSTLRLLQ